MSEKEDTPITWEDPTREYKIRQRWEETCPLTMCEAKITGILPEVFEFGLKNWIEWNPISEDGVMFYLKEMEGDRKIVH